MFEKPYTYKWIKPSASPPFEKRIRRTRGKITPPCGPFGFRYAVFRNRSSEVLVPLHDLTIETRERLTNMGADV